jgi:hypothetical protein
MQSEQPLETTNTQEPEGQARPEDLTVLQSARIIAMLKDGLAGLKEGAKHPWASKGRFRFAIDMFEQAIRKAEAIHDESHR